MNLMGESEQNSMGFIHKNVVIISLEKILNFQTGRRPFSLLRTTLPVMGLYLIITVISMRTEH